MVGSLNSLDPFSLSRGASEAGKLLPNRTSNSLHYGNLGGLTEALGEHSMVNSPTLTAGELLTYSQG